MNIRRGFFRFWIILGVGWFATFAAIQSSDVINPPVSEKVYVLPSAKADFYQFDHPSNQYDENTQKNHRTIQFPNHVQLLVHNSVSKADGDARGKGFYEEYSRPRETEVAWARLAVLGRLGLVGVIPPLVLLMVGWAAAWGLAGFKVDKA